MEPLFRIRSTLIALLFTGVSSVAQSADTGSLAVSAVVPSKSNCKLSAGALTLAFGAIDPAQAVDATASATTNFTCTGSAPLATFAISADNGLHSTGPGARRMRHTTVPTEFMAYGLALSPTSATVPKGSVETLTVTGTIQPFQFQNAHVGTYQDTVVITLTP